MSCSIIITRLIIVDVLHTVRMMALEQRLQELQEQYKLDEIDRKILRAYQMDASVSYKELGEILGLAPTTVFDRIKQLKRVGVIKSLIPLLEMEQLGLRTTVWMLIKTGTDPDCCQVADEIAKNPDVMEVHEVAGAYDLVVKVKARDNLHYHNISDRISKIKGVKDTFSTISLRTVKEDIRPNI